jgi:uncharacterized damage-inducible protein DinB
MNWTKLLTSEIESTYAVADKLMEKVDDGKLDWTPTEGGNWMTTGQLLCHMTTACGAVVKGFVTGDWGMPEGMDPSDLKPEDMLPPASSMPTIGSTAEARKKLAEDKNVALGNIQEAGEDNLANQDTTAPWDPNPMKLGQRLLHMVGHLGNHKSQLYYYLKLQGVPVNTWDLYGA